MKACSRSEKYLQLLSAPQTLAPTENSLQMDRYLITQQAQNSHHPEREAGHAPHLAHLGLAQILPVHLLTLLGPLVIAPELLASGVDADA